MDPMRLAQRVTRRESRSVLLQLLRQQAPHVTHTVQAKNTGSVLGKTPRPLRVRLLVLIRKKILIIITIVLRYLIVYVFRSGY